MYNENWQDRVNLILRKNNLAKKDPHGATIIVEPDELVHHGRYVVAKRSQDSEVTFKQYMVDGGRAYLNPLNPRYPVMEIDDSCIIIGVVVEVSMRVV